MKGVEKREYLGKKEKSRREGNGGRETGDERKAQKVSERYIMHYVPLQSEILDPPLIYVLYHVEISHTIFLVKCVL